MAVSSDSDLPNLSYLNAIVKETMRVHPPKPLLSWARMDVGEHFIPTGTTTMVNMYAITPDERIWSESEKFMPKRFLEEDVPIMGSDLRLAPFGSGHRVCPGKVMGYTQAFSSGWLSYSELQVGGIWWRKGRTSLRWTENPASYFVDVN